MSRVCWLENISDEEVDIVILMSLVVEEKDVAEYKKWLTTKQLQRQKRKLDRKTRTQNALNSWPLSYPMLLNYVGLGSVH